MDKISYLVAVCLICYIGESWSMTREQMKKTGKVMKNSCMPKNQVTEDMVGNIEQGTFIEEKNVMCYIACIYQMIGVVKNGKTDVTSAIKQVDILYPPDVKEPAKKAINACADIANNYKDLCESAYWTAKCMYDFDPKNYLFP